MVSQELNEEYFYLLSDLYDRFLSLEDEETDKKGGQE